MNIIQEIRNRWAASSPIFFKKLQALGLSLTGLAGTLMAIPTVSESIQHIAGYVLTAGAVLAAIAKLTVADPSVLEKGKEEV